MQRLTAIQPDQAQGRVKEIFEGPLKGKHFNIFKALANSPAALDAYLGLSGALSKSRLTAAEREIVQLVIGEQNRCDYCVAAHTKLGMGAGLSEPQTLEARRGRMTDPRHAALTRFVLAIQEKKGFVSDADVSEFRKAGYDDGHIAEAVAAFALATYTNYFNHVNHTDIDFPAAPPLK